MTEQYENWFQVDRHANGGFIILRMINEHGVPFDLKPLEIPQGIVPPDLREIGSRFRMRWGALNAGTIAEIRENRNTVYQITGRWPEDRQA